MSVMSEHGAMLAAPDPLDLARHSLFLDLDGTLVDIIDRPQDVQVSRRTRQLLSDLDGALQGRLVILSGRSLVQLDELLGSAALKAGGGHGRERRPGAPVAPFALPGWAEADLAELVRHHPGLLIERKTSGTALHYRACPAARDMVAASAERVAAGIGAVVQPGKMVFEIKPADADKGEALRAFMALPDFDGTRPVMVGDDLTDEAAFRSAAALGGFGIHVGDPRETRAGFRLPSPAAVLDWLQASIAP